MKAPPSAGPKQTHREVVAEAGRKERRAYQDIAPLPFPPLGEKASLRERSDSSLLAHLEICYPAAFDIPWSSDHLRLIEEVEQRAEGGGLKAIAMPRSSGKTSILLRAACWAILTGRRRFVVIVTATDEDASDMFKKKLKPELIYNQQLADLYPIELYAIKDLGGEARRAGGQHYGGTLTGVSWKETEVGFGWVPEAANAGSLIVAVGITGAIRGMSVTLPTGEVLRPDLLLIDEPQTKASAKSPSQSRHRYEIIMGDCLGMAGPQEPIAGLLSGTVIYRNDAMDRALDRRLSPQWNGDRCKLVYDWPEREDLWHEYRTIRDAENAGVDTPTTARQFLIDNFDEMHRGSRVGWEERKGPEHVSGLHYAYDLLFRDEPTFWSEYQNTPFVDQGEVPFELDPVLLMQRVNGVPPGVVPEGANILTAFVDVQKNVLFYMVVAWTPEGRGHVIEYGTWPDQQRQAFTKRSLAVSLQEMTGLDNFREAIYEGLSQLTSHLLSRPYQLESRQRGEANLFIRRMGIDARWGYSTSTIREFCRASRNADRLHPMLGHYGGPNAKPWAQLHHTKWDRLGVHCKLQPPPKGKSGVMEILVDTNWWKAYVSEGLACNAASHRAIQLYDAPPYRHQTLAEHWTAEEATTATGKAGNTVIEFILPNDAPDNDWWDTLVGNAVLGSIEGVTIEVGQEFKAQPQERKTKNVRSSKPARW